MSLDDLVLELVLATNVVESPLGVLGFLEKHLFEILPYSHDVQLMGVIEVVNPAFAAASCQLDIDHTEGGLAHVFNHEDPSPLERNPLVACGLHQSEDVVSATSPLIVVFEAV